MKVFSVVCIVFGSLALLTFLSAEGSLAVDYDTPKQGILALAPVLSEAHGFILPCASDKKRRGNFVTPGGSQIFYGSGHEAKKGEAAE